MCEGCTCLKSEKASDATKDEIEGWTKQFRGCLEATRSELRELQRQDREISAAISKASHKCSELEKLSVIATDLRWK